MRAPQERGPTSCSGWLASFASLACGLVASCAGYEETPTQFEQEEQAARERLLEEPLAVRGCVSDQVGEPVPDVQLELRGRQARSDQRGCFSIEGIRRENAMLSVRHEGFRDELVPVHLVVPVSQGVVQLGNVRLEPAQNQRLIFGGDVQLGRRMLDPDQSTPLDRVPEDDPEALILASDPLPGSKALFRHVREVLTAADVALVNLETVVTRNPATPDRDNTFVFFTLPESLPALTWAGIDYVSLANNHSYDYLDAGVRDTLAAVDDAGLARSGSGMDAEQAFRAAELAVGEQTYSILSFSSIEGTRGLDDTSALPDRAGVASLNDSARIDAALAGQGTRPVVVMAHTGYEYTAEPPDDGHTLPTLEGLAAGGADLVVAHHPHVAQGFSFAEDALVAHSLGNFAFDQDRLETLSATALEVDFREGALVSALARAVRIENYSPRFLAGEGAVRYAKTLSRASEPFGAYVIPEPKGGRVVSSLQGASPRSRTVEVEVPLDAQGQGIVDLREYLQLGESPVSVMSPDALIRVGRNLLPSGDFEDYSVDDAMEAPDWFYSGLDAEVVSGFLCASRVYRGALALCSVRTDLNTGESTLSFRRRIRVPGDKINRPNKDLTVIARVFGQNAGPARGEVEYQASLGTETFGSQVVFEREPGDYGWTRVWAHLDMPEDGDEAELSSQYSAELRRSSARALRLRFFHGPPLSGQSLFALDDVAVVAWQPDSSPLGTWRAPNDWEFLLVTASPGLARAELIIEVVGYSALEQVDDF